MKKFISSIFALAIILGFTGCGSTSSIYTVQPTPLKQGETSYSIKNLKVNLSHGHGRNLENKTFKDEVALEESFKDFIIKDMKEKNIYDENSKYSIELTINYKRTYNYGGNALNKPEVSHIIKVYDNTDRILVSYGSGKYTTKYAYFKDALVNAEIALFQWDVEDEPKDVKFLSELLVKDISKLGK